MNTPAILAIISFVNSRSEGQASGCGFESSLGIRRRLFRSGPLSGSHEDGV